ncbi:hypothetical protein DPMN_104401 [Dreissena polymorpha]|uniref:Uncharacterized protein n=1 Tax=Dreissena polymorpha TaxID=45954 RepID=A0A9D4K1L8_DREPO|nr:hypothetical protein DPMN_104401 [Dreissena polymorpha]
MSSPIRNLVSGSRSAGLQHFRASERWVSRVPCTITTGYQVKEFLARYPGILEEYLIENVSTEFLEGILIRKRAESRKPTDVGATSDRERSQLKLERMYTEIGIDKLARNICECSSDEEILEKIYEAAGILGAIVEAEKRSMYMTDVNNIDMYRYVPEQKSHRKHVGPMGLKLTVSAHVAFTKQSVNVADLPQDSRFPKGRIVK